MRKNFTTVFSIFIADVVLACTTFSFSDKIQNRNDFHEYT